MVAEALVLADPYLMINGTNGGVRMSQCTSDVVAYSHLTDGVLSRIEYSEGKVMQGALLQKRLFWC